MTGSTAGRWIDVAAQVRFADGTPAAGQEIEVAQVEHGFRFGATGFEAIPLASGELDSDPAALAVANRLHERWLEVFNTATLPFYWGRFEPEEGRPDTDRVAAAARWFRARGVEVKGHPLCWHTLTAPWLRDLPVADVERLQVDRIRREVTGFAGLIDTWDVINEVVIMPVFEKEANGITRLAQHLGRVGIVRTMFEAARAANPGAFLLLNDFDLGPDYERLIADSLEAGIRIDAIGLQSHMHQGYWGEEETERILDRYARFGLPLHWTENTIVSGDLMPPHIVDLNDWQVASWPSTPDGLARQADEVVRHYRTLVGHPSVASITWWGLPDGEWLNAPNGLVFADGTPKPAFTALRDLVRGEWWLAPTVLHADDAGVVRFRGFPGRYRVRAGDAAAEFTVGCVGSGIVDAGVPAPVLVVTASC